MSTTMNATSEQAIERYLAARTRDKGGQTYKVHCINRNGMPDRLVLLPNSVTLWVELKAPGKRCKPHQLREHTRLRALGQRVVVIDSLDAVDKELQ
ncbi:MAG TPA: VRR-NUC domain-containing protein [Xylella fastidiosa subsp. multiplex]|uniref:VRR-NUC domain-containing protein n=2 Tax=Xylella fastidiosa TaxID=2371 RepID=A0AAJ5R1V2_XYLFS|nr:VRR-NUC domain-containing protein [Xylella fastidiosa]MDD0930251.1 VRR-NUC domain-containing protein [Xylella fastidiosa subsp. multiplex]UIT42036.1 VRR-NUC domain-containing protein [Xylella fastidiosa subsp. multiplex]WCF29090.1 VRR-NUC domain-containing protein [Xylella fastidiosa subsp. fastidiosa]WNY20092.1 VRR-NUC domain-containing protein [Xylella fastidiosa]WNY22386.1 VRR-NUC domain-containing protein [Xylella fastidiosa]